MPEATPTTPQARNARYLDIVETLTGMLEEEGQALLRELDDLVGERMLDYASEQDTVMGLVVDLLEAAQEGPGRWRRVVLAAASEG